jgi:hypothetical protein
VSSFIKDKLDSKNAVGVAIRVAKINRLHRVLYPFPAPHENGNVYQEVEIFLGFTDS